MPSRETENRPTTSAEAQPSDANDFEPLPEGRERASVLDFLYHDARRVGSFLAQFETYGVVSQVKATEATGRTEATKTVLTGGVQIPLAAQGQIVRDVTSGADERDLAERTYDPFWTNARTLLDYLTEHSMLQRDIWSARIGQFVLVSGTLIVLDIMMLKNAWEKPSVKKKVLEGSSLATTQTSRTVRRRQSVPNDDAQFLLELLTILPHAVQVHLFGEQFGVWCSLSEDSLVGLSSDLVLKHGSYVPGVWSMLGILDALPDPKPEPTDDGRAVESIDALVAREAGTLVGTLAAQLAPVTRELLGRPRRSFGMTPLLIFREVAGEAREEG